MYDDGEYFQKKFIKKIQSKPNTNNSNNNNNKSHCVFLSWHVVKIL
jgi:hypothetical protein